MTACKNGDGHTAPCAWSRAMMWLAVVLISLAAFVSGNLNGRISAVEKQSSDTREAIAGLKVSMDYAVRDLGDIKITLRKTTLP